MLAGIPSIAYADEGITSDEITVEQEDIFVSEDEIIAEDEIVLEDEIPVIEETESSEVEITEMASDASVESIYCNKEKSDVEKGSYLIEIKGLQVQSGFRKVRVAVWSRTNGLDDRTWYEAKLDADGTWYVDVQLYNHKYAADTCYLNVFIVDNNNQLKLVDGTTFTTQEMAKDLLCIEKNETQSVFTATMMNISASVTGKVDFAVWGERGGQDDLIWYKGEKLAEGTYAVNPPIASHGDYGKYCVDVYINNGSGRTYLTSGSIYIDGMTQGQLSSNVDRDVATIEAALSGVTGPSLISNVKMAVWTTAGGQDDIKWYEAQKQGESWKYLIDTANHGFETGEYNIHAYAVDIRGIQQFVGGTAANMQVADGVKLSYAMADNKSEVYFEATGIRGAKKVQLAVWGSENGQNDLKWYTLSRAIGTKYAYTINLYDHLETGTYKCDLYVTDSSGTRSLAGKTEFVVDNLANNYLRISDIDNVDGNSKARVYFPNAGFTINRISFAVWTEANGKDDLQWYEAVNEGSYWTAVIDSLKHNEESGKYMIEAYAFAADGTSSMLAASNFQMTRISRVYQNPSQYYQIQDSITLSGGGYTLSYGFEGVKVMKVIQRLGLGSGVGMGGAFYGQDVINAVSAFQRSAGLPATGNVDLLTWLRLGFSEIEWTQWGAYVAPLKVTRTSTRAEHIEAMISTAYSYLGNPYVIGAAGPPGTGIDCSGLVMQALYSAGIDTSPINPVRHAHPGYEYESRNMWSSPYFKHVSYEERQRGDLIFYQNGNGVVIHVAIYLGNDQVIESWPNEVVVWPIKNWARSNVKGVVRPFV